MFVDSSGWLCIFDGDDRRQEEASALLLAAQRPFTTSYVLAEFIPLAHTRRLIRREYMAFAQAITLNPTVEVVWVDESLHRRAFALLEARMDKQYSLCDAVSFVLMRERGILGALTTDHHFEQEGFRRLLPQNA